MIKRGSKKGYEFGFAWFFTVVVGATIIVLAVYAATQIVKTNQFQRESLQGRQIGTLLTPLETKLEEGSFGILFVPEETTIFNNCTRPSNRNPFGSQLIAVSTDNTFSRNLNEDEEASFGVENTFHNKYIFANENPTGEEEFYVFSKPFHFPYKIADLIMIWGDTEKYCFDTTDAPIDLTSELKKLNMDNIFRKDSSNNDCPADPNMITVCFSGSCDIKVNTGENTVTHRPKPPVKYEESFNLNDRYALLYAAIFSEPEVYECQIERLMEHTAILAEAYSEKANYIYAQSNCAQTMEGKLGNYARIAREIDSSSGISSLRASAGGVRSANPPLCKIF